MPCTSSGYGATSPPNSGATRVARHRSSPLGTSCLEFLCELCDRLIPVEVKSGWVTQAKSLKVFCDKYQPPFCAVLSARPLDAAPERRKRYYPLYLAARFLDPEFSNPSAPRQDAQRPTAAP